MSKNPIYRVTFLNHGKVYEVYVRYVEQSDLMGFIEISEFVFGQTSGVLLDPGQERLKNEFSGVSLSVIPMHSVIRIDAVEKEGIAKISDSGSKGSNITQFPMGIFTPPNSEG